MGNNIVEPILIGITLLIFVIYHIYLVQMIKTQPLKTAAGQVWISKRRWCQIIMDPARDMLIEGIQTVRNTLMATSVLASTSLALSSVVVAFLAAGLVDLGISDDFWMRAPAITDAYRFFVIIFFFGCAFFCYMQSIRSVNHSGYLIAIPIFNEQDKYSVTPDYVAKVLNRGAMFYTIGTRFFYLALLGVLWFFGPFPPLISCIILVFALYFLDRYPDIHYHKKSAPEGEINIETVL